MADKSSHESAARFRCANADRCGGGSPNQRSASVRPGIGKFARLDFDQPRPDGVGADVPFIDLVHDGSIFAGAFGHGRKI
jgi:hypothetical protein